MFPRSFQTYADFNSGLQDVPIYSIDKSSDGTYWIGTLQGLAQARKSVGYTISQANTNLNSDTVNGIHISDDGTLWLATDQGVSYRRAGESNFQHVNQFTHSKLKDPVAMAVTATNEIGRAHV